MDRDTGYSHYLMHCQPEHVFKLLYRSYYWIAGPGPSKDLFFVMDDFCKYTGVRRADFARLLNHFYPLWLQHRFSITLDSLPPSDRRLAQIRRRTVSCLVVAGLDCYSITMHLPTRQR